MKVLALVLFTVLLAAAADEQQLALLMKAQADFDRVDLNPSPPFPDTSACVLSQAALLPVASAADLPIVHYRKGYCTLIGATITQNASSFTEAAGEFQKAMDAWRGRVALQPKKAAPEPMSSALPVLAAISRLLAPSVDASGTSAARQQIAAAVASPSCPSSLMPTATCQADLQLGREWLGWIALSHVELTASAESFSSLPDSGWPAWVKGRRAFEAANYREAVTEYRAAIETWQRARRNRLAPPTDLGLALTDLGGAQLLAGDAATAITTLDQAIRTDPSHARAFFYRARAKEVAGRGEAALFDYSLASRTAFAETVDLASGEAHLYRGIADFRRKDFPRAEDEFSNALNFSIPDALRGDASAWRQMAAVAAGNCESARQILARDLAKVSPFFPKNDAETLMTACPTTSAAK